MYKNLAKQFIKNLHDMGKHHQHKKINDSVRGEKMAMHFILRQGGSTYPKNIETAMGISSARVAAIIKRLEQKNLVIRKEDELDKRKTLVMLTEDGKNMASEYDEKLLFVISKSFEYIGEKDSKELIRIMEKILDVMPQVKEDSKQKFRRREENIDKDN